MLSGDFNHVTKDATLPTFHQFVDCAARKNRTIDLFYANASEAYIVTPLGKSDHNFVFLKPQYKPCVISQSTTTRTFRKWCPEAEEILKDCFECTDRSVLQKPHNSDIEEITHCMTAYLNFCMDIIVPVGTVCCFPNNLPNRLPVKSSFY